MNRKPIEAPSMNTTLFYGAILSHQFIGDISKDRDKYRIRIIFTFKTGEKYTKHIGFRTKTEAKKAKEVLIAELACKITGLSVIQRKNFSTFGCTIINYRSKKLHMQLT